MNLLPSSIVLSLVHNCNGVSYLSEFLQTRAFRQTGTVELHTTLIFPTFQPCLSEMGNALLFLV